MITILHELCHFYDPFECDLEVFSKVEEKYFLDREKYVENEVKLLINERSANYRAFSIHNLLLERVSNEDSLKKEIERVKTRIYNHIDKLDDEFINSLNDLIGMNSTEFQTQHHGDIKFFDILFRQIHYFLGGFDALKSANINTKDLEWEWYRMIFKIKNKIIKNLTSFLLPRDYKITLILFKILNLDLTRDLDKNIKEVRKIVKKTFANLLSLLKDSIQDYDHIRDTFNLVEFIDKFMKFIKSETLLIIIYLATLSFYTT